MSPGRQLLAQYTQPDVRARRHRPQQRTGIEVGDAFDRATVAQGDPVAAAQGDRPSTDRALQPQFDVDRVFAGGPALDRPVEIGHQLEQRARESLPERGSPHNHRKPWLHEANAAVKPWLEVICELIGAAGRSPAVRKRLHKGLRRLLGITVEVFCHRPDRQSVWYQTVSRFTRLGN